MQNGPDMLLLISSFSLGVDLSCIFAIKCLSTGHIIILHGCAILLEILGLQMSEQGWIDIWSLVIRHGLDFLMYLMWVCRSGCRISFGFEFALHLLETWVNLTALFWHAVLGQRRHCDSSDRLEGTFRANLFEILGVFAGYCFAGRDGHLPLLVLLHHGHRFEPT